jgi:hypothetical protein
MRGGGVYLEGGYPNCVVVAGNCISGNVADYIGGGLAEVNWSYDTAFVQGNVLDSNTAGLYGGGVYLYYCLSLATSPSIYDLDDNTITNNCVPNSAGASGGGVYAAGWCFPARRNVITGNAPSGVYTQDAAGSAIFGTMDLGTSQDPGYNVLMQNGGHDLVMVVSVGPINTNAVGNYWGTLNTQTILNRILLLGDGHVLFGPVAASGKWFDVNVSSRCTTGVIVTGDLSVESGTSLQLTPGDTLGFLLAPDYSCPGFDPTLCDLILQSGSTISALGTPVRPIVFKGRPNLGDPEVAGDWYGISVCSQSTATFSHCVIRSAYNALDAFDGASLTADTSSIYNNALCGVLASGTGASLCLVGDTISWNGVYGVRCINVQPGTRIERNTLLQNATYGISCEVSTSTQSSWVRHNRVTLYAPMSNSLFGIDLRGVGSSLAIDTNYVARYPQAGIYEQTSSAPILFDTIVSIQNDGIRCVSGSTPNVRWTMIDTCKTGVLVDPTSLPDLGNQQSPGDNSILLNNYRYVCNQHTSVPPVLAEYDWWGCAPPVPGKFVGLVDHSYWLSGPPPLGGQMGGGQSSGINPLQVPKEIVLDQNWPNPATGSLSIRYGVPKMANVSLNVYDISGKLVRTLATNDKVKPGYYDVNWNCRDNQDRAVARGVYFYRLETSDGQQTRGGKPAAGVKTRKLLIAR